MFLKLLLIVAVCCYIIATTEGLTIRELSAEDDTPDDPITSSPTESSYRKTVAKIQETSYRVPEHLQFIPKGFIYEDADDVIHVIDPPKHFEELKKIMQRQQQRRLSNLRPIALREQRPKPKIVKTIMPLKHKAETRLRKPLPELDLQTQESQHLPLEILASVRKTENYLRKYKPKLPAVKQRLKTQKIQTVIWEKQQDQQQFQQGQQQRVQGVREQETANRRGGFTKKRFRREIKASTDKSLRGPELLKHINELIQNASAYLEENDNEADLEEESTTTLKGEILVQTTKTPLTNRTAINEELMVKILENSVKATNAIMQQIKAQTNLTSTVTDKCDYLKVTYSNHIQNLQNQIKCMQNFIKDINQVLQPQPPLNDLAKYEKHYGERLPERQSKNLKHKHFLVAQLADDYVDDVAATPLNSSLIYSDVMTTIRNMWQTQNLQSIEDNVNRFFYEDPLPDSSFTYDKSPEPVDLENLQEYLTSLQAIVTNLPSFNQKSLNLQEMEGGEGRGGDSSNSKYYFVNPQGSIYSLPQPFQKDVTTTAPSTIFHQFPDLPIVTEYLQNGTLLPISSSFSSKVVEIL